MLSDDVADGSFGKKTFDAIACNELFLTLMLVRIMSPIHTAFFDRRGSTLAQGLYHFNNQQNQNKTALIVANAGHSALRINPRDCMHEIYEAAWSDKSIVPFLKDCSASVMMLGQQ